MTSFPCCVWTTSGWNCRPIRPASLPITATGLLSVKARLRKPCGISATLSPWLIQTGTEEGTFSNNGKSSSF